MESIASQVNITVGYSIITVIAYPALALCLVGIWVTRSPREAIKRLGLERVDARQVGIAFGMVIPVLILGIGLDATVRLSPERYAQLESVLKAMSSNVTNPVPDPRPLFGHRRGDPLPGGDPAAPRHLV